MRANILGPDARGIYPVSGDLLRKHVKSDKIAFEREEYREERPDPSFMTRGPKTRREFLNVEA